MAKITYEARIPEYDGASWEYAEGWDAASVAETYAKEANQRSGQELMMKEDDTVTVIVRDTDGKVSKWTVSLGYIEVYSANYEAES